LVNANKIIKNIQYRPDIDGLRGFAILGVLAFHFNQNLFPNGYLGVDIFFVISGFVITLSINKNQEKNFISFLSYYYEKRIKRLLPALLFYVLITSLFICLINPLPIHQLRTAITSLVGISNIYLYNSSSGYFTSSGEFNPFLQTWSLSVEEQFYLIFPFLCFFSGFIKGEKYGKNLFSFFLIIFSIISFVWFIINFTNNENSYFLINGRFWEISLGILSYILINSRNGLAKFIQNLPSNYLFFSLIFLVFSPFKIGYYSILLVVILTSLLIQSIKKESLGFGLLSEKNIVKLGKMSYSIYLWHWGVISLSHWTIGVNKFTIPIQLLLIYFFSNISYKFIECPFRRIQTKRKLFSYLAGIFSIMISQATLFAFGLGFYKRIYTGNLNNSFNRSFVSRNILLNKCNLRKIKFINFLSRRNCLPKASNIYKSSIFLVGDSHANMFSKAISYNSKNVRLVNLTGNNCFFPANNLIFRNTSNDFDLCQKNMEEVDEWILKNSTSGDSIVIANSRLIEYFQFEKDKFSSSIDNLKLLINKYRDKGIKIYFIASPPFFKKVSDPYCSQEWFRPNIFIRKECFIKRDKLDKKRALFFNAMNNEIQYKNFKVINKSLESYCGKTICQASGYMDSNHLIDDFALKIIKEYDFN